MAIVVTSAQTLHVPESCNPVCAAPVCVPCVTECLTINRLVNFVCLDDFVTAIKKYGTYKEGTERLAAPDTALYDEVRYALQDFTRHSFALRRRANLVTVAGKRDYDIEPLANEQIHRIESVCVNGECLPFKDGQCCDVCEYGISGWSFELPAKIVFDRADCAGIKIEVKYIAETTHDACLVDDIVLKRYKEAIINGAASRLLTLPAWEWTAPSFGLNAQKKYDKLLAEAKIDRWNRFTRSRNAAFKPNVGRVY